MASAGAVTSTNESDAANVEYFHKECVGINGEQYRAYVEAGIAAARVGNRLLARMNFEAAAHLKRDAVTTWLWLASTADSPAHSISCLEYVRHFAPDHPLAITGLQWFQQLDRLAEAVAAEPHCYLPPVPNASQLCDTCTENSPEAATCCTDVECSNFFELTEIIEPIEYTEAIDVSALYESVAEIEAPCEDIVCVRYPTTHVSEPEAEAVDSPSVSETYDTVMQDLQSAESLIANAIAASTADKLGTQESLIADCGVALSADEDTEPADLQSDDSAINAELAAARCQELAVDPEEGVNWIPEELRAVASDSEFFEYPTLDEPETPLAPEVVWEQIETLLGQQTAPSSESESECCSHASVECDQSVEPIALPVDAAVDPIADAVTHDVTPESETELLPNPVETLSVVEPSEASRPDVETELLHSVESLVAEAAMNFEDAPIEDASHEDAPNNESQSAGESAADAFASTAWGDPDLISPTTSNSSTSEVVEVLAESTASETASSSTSATSSAELAASSAAHDEPHASQVAQSEPTESVIENQFESAAPTTHEFTSAEAARTSVVIADDSPTIRKLIGGILRGAGYHVIETEDGVAALREIKLHLPSIVLMDINMPKLDGYRVCRLVKSYEATQHIPVVLVSGLASEANVLRGRLVGCAAYLTKPVTPESLLETVQTQLAAFASG